nr:MAG TPA: hypothetical protein [Caudoviricetes sp.]
MRQNGSFVLWKRFRRNEKEAFNPFQSNCFVGYPENPAFASKHLRLPAQLSCWISSTPFGNRFASETVRKLKHSSERIRNSISAFTWTKPANSYNLSVNTHHFPDKTYWGFAIVLIFG